MKLAALIPTISIANRANVDVFRHLGTEPLLFKTIDTVIESNQFKKVSVIAAEEKSAVIRRRYSRSDVSILSPPIPEEEITCLGDLLDWYFCVDETADVCGLFLPEYPFRSAERIKRDIAPHLCAKQVYKIDSRASDIFATFDYWLPVQGGMVPAFSWYPLFIKYINETYIFFTKHYHYGNLYNIGLCHGEKVLTVNCDERESFALLSEADFESAEKYLIHGELCYRPIKETEFEDVQVVSPQGVDAASLFSLFEQDGNRIESPRLVVENVEVDLNRLDFQAINETRMLMHRRVYRLFQKARHTHGKSYSMTMFRQNPFYRVNERTNKFGREKEFFVPDAHILHQSDLEEWNGYVEPCFWPEI